MHGNEPAGVLAIRRVLDELARTDVPFSGDLIGIVGNRRALADGRRYIDEDLNRRWTQRGGTTAEALEQQELKRAIQDALAEARGEVYVVDLHTSSAQGPPFASIGDTLRNRTFARRFALPIILGIEEHVDGSLLEYINHLGHVTLGIEGGQHDAPESIDSHAAAIWSALVAAGNLQPAALPQFTASREALSRLSEGLPRILEISHRHRIAPGQTFQMTPGFRNFDRVRAGQVLAHDEQGEVRAAQEGRLMLPLYQGQGSDGFFQARRVRPIWLLCSDVMRRLRVAAVLTWLPGVRCEPARPDELVIHPAWPRKLLINLLHLLGYRKHRQRDGRLVVRRRKYEARTPRLWVSARFRQPSESNPR